MPPKKKAQATAAPAVATRASARTKKVVQVEPGKHSIAIESLH